MKVIPVINENDTVVNDEIKFGDNDTLGALVANLVEADALVILTDQRACIRPTRARTRTPLHRRGGCRRPALERWPVAPAAASAAAACSPRCWPPSVRRQRRQHRDRLGPRARRAAAPGRRRGIGTAPGGQHRQAGGAQAVDGRPPAAARRGQRGRGRCSSLRDEGKSLLPIGVTRGRGRVPARRRDRRARPAGPRNWRVAWPTTPAARRASSPQAVGQIEALLGYAASPN
jgi:glutamate 5-kinase